MLTAPLATENVPVAWPKAIAPDPNNVAKVSRAFVSLGSVSVDPSAIAITAVSASAFKALKRPSSTENEPLPDSVARMPAMLRPRPTASNETSSLPDAVGRPSRSHTSDCSATSVSPARTDTSA